MDEQILTPPVPESPRPVTPVNDLHHDHKRVMVFGGIGIIVMLGALFYTYWLGVSSFKKINEEAEKAKQEMLALEERRASTSRVSHDLKTYQYVNEKLGFLILVPDLQPVSTCKWDGDSYRPGEQELVPVKIFEEDKNVYISLEYMYVLEGETNNNAGYYFYSECSKKQLSTNLIRSGEYPYDFGWNIIVQSVKDDSEIDKFIKENYGAGCSYQSKELTNLEGVFNINIKTDGLSLDESTCPLNYITRLRYYAPKNIIAKYDLGQAVTYIDAQGGSLDTKMDESFRFLP